MVNMGRHPCGGNAWKQDPLRQQHSKPQGLHGGDMSIRQLIWRVFWWSEAVMIRVNECLSTDARHAPLRARWVVGHRPSCKRPQLLAGPSEVRHLPPDPCELWLWKLFAFHQDSDSLLEDLLTLVEKSSPRLPDPWEVFWSCGFDLLSAHRRFPHISSSASRTLKASIHVALSKDCECSLRTGNCWYFSTEANAWERRASL